MDPRGAPGLSVSSVAPVSFSHRSSRASMPAPTVADPSRARRPADRGLSPARVALLVAVAHGVTDAYVAFLTPLLPRLMEKLGLSIALAAALAMVLSLASSLLQPLLGYLADRFGRRGFVAAGPLLAGAFLSLIGLAPSATVLALLLVAGGLGSAAFHPPGATLAARVEEGGGSGLRLSFFSFGGTLGFALGPLAAVGLVGAVGLEGLWTAMFPGLLLAGVLLWLLPRGRRDRSPDPPPSPARLLRHLRGPLGLIFGVSAAGAFVQRAYLTMEPIVVAEAGGSEATGALMLSVYLAAQAGGTLAGGWLADRVDRGRLLALLTLLAIPPHLLAVGLEPGSAGALAMAAVAGFLNMAVLPPIVVTAQELVPEGAAATSGIVMGLAWATGSVGVLATGVLGDHLGARAATLLSMPVLIVGTALALHPALGRALTELARERSGRGGASDVL